MKNLGFEEIALPRSAHGLFPAQWCVIDATFHFHANNLDLGISAQQLRQTVQRSAHCGKFWFSRVARCDN